jgi:hypothetical protein
LPRSLEVRRNKYPRLAGLDEFDQPAIFFTPSISLASCSTGHAFPSAPISSHQGGRVSPPCRPGLSGRIVGSRWQGRWPGGVRGEAGELARAVEMFRACRFPPSRGNAANAGGFPLEASFFSRRSALAWRLLGHRYDLGGNAASLAGAEPVRVAVSLDGCGAFRTALPPFRMSECYPRSELSWLVFTLVRTVPSHADKSMGKGHPIHGIAG